MKRAEAQRFTTFIRCVASCGISAGSQAACSKTTVFRFNRYQAMSQQMKKNDAAFRADRECILRGQRDYREDSARSFRYFTSQQYDGDGQCRGDRLGGKLACALDDRGQKPTPAVPRIRQRGERGKTAQFYRQRQSAGGRRTQVTHQKTGQNQEPDQAPVGAFTADITRWLYFSIASIIATKISNRTDNAAVLPAGKTVQNVRSSRCQPDA